MSNAAIAATGGAGAAAAIMQAIKASGAIVRVEPADFTNLVEKAEDPLVVCCESRFIFTSYQYLMGYKGLVFFTKSPTPLVLPQRIETINCKKIWIPA